MAESVRHIQRISVSHKEHNYVISEKRIEPEVSNVYDHSVFSHIQKTGRKKDLEGDEY